MSHDAEPLSLYARFFRPHCAFEAYRILNASFHNLTVLTYDHVLARAQRISGIGEELAHLTRQTQPGNASSRALRSGDMLPFAARW
jgi:hypothetical protein